MGGILGLIAAALKVGRRAVLNAALTKGILGALLVGCIGGFVLPALGGEGVVDHSTFAGAVGGSFLGFLIGTVVGTWMAARKQKEKETSAAAKK